MDRNEFIQILKNHGMKPVKSNPPLLSDWENYDNSKQIIDRILSDNNENTRDQMLAWVIEWLGV